MLGFVLRASAAVLAAVFVAALLTRGSHPLWPVYGAFAAFLLVGLGLEATGRIETAGIVVTLGFWATASATVFLMGGVRSPGTFVMVPIVATAALFWDWRAAGALTLASIGIELFAAYLESAHLMPPPLRTPTTATLWRVFAGSVAMTGVLVGLAQRGVRSAIADVREMVHRRAIMEVELAGLLKRVEQGHRLGRFSFVEQELRQLLDRRLVVRVGFQDGAQNFLGFVVLVSQAVQAREPEGGLCVGRIEAIDFLVLLDGTRGDLGLAAVLAQVAQAAEVNSREQAASRHIIGIALENILRFSNRVAQALRLPVHLRQTLTNHRRLGIQRIGLLIKFDGLRRVFRLAGVFVLLLVDVPHGEVVVGVGTVGRRGCRAARQRDTRSGRGGWQLTLWRGRRGSFRLSLCRLLRPGIGPSQRAKEGCGNGQSTKVHKYPETKSIPCGSGTVKRQNCGISLLWKCLPIGCGNGDKR